MLVNHGCNGHGGKPRTAVGSSLDIVKYHQSGSGIKNNNNGNRRHQERKRDFTEDLECIRSVNSGGFQDIGGDGLQSGDCQYGRQCSALPDIDHKDGPHGGSAAAQERFGQSSDSESLPEHRQETVVNLIKNQSDGNAAEDGRKKVDRTEK